MGGSSEPPIFSNMAYEELSKLSTADLEHALNEHGKSAEAGWIEAVIRELTKRNPKHEDPNK